MNFPIQYINRDHYPKEGGFIIACNHTSYLDPPLVAISTKRRISFMARDSLFRHIFLGWFISSLEAFPVKREQGDFRAIRESMKRLKSGMPVLMFPEGTRILEQRTRKALPGIGLIARKAGVPVLPVRVLDSEKALPPGAKWFKRHLVKVIVGKPFFVSDDQSPEKIADSIMNHIYELS